MTPRFFAHINAAGPIRFGQAPDSIGILEAPDRHRALGMAFETGWTEGGLKAGGPGC